MRNPVIRLGTALLTVLLPALLPAVLIAGAGAAYAGHHDGDYTVTSLVSDGSVPAPVTDPKLVNAWGLAASPTSPSWVGDNGTGFATVYTGAGVKNPLEVAVPGAPTGVVWNGLPGWLLP